MGDLGGAYSHRRTAGVTSLLLGLMILPLTDARACPSWGQQSPCNGGWLRNHTYTGRNQVLQKLFDGYDSLVRPGADKGERTVVSVDIFINSVDSISVDTMDYSLNLYMRQTWVDERLQYNETELGVDRLILDHRLYNEIWVPDLFFSNEKRSNIHCVTVPNSMIRIYSNGTVLYSARYTLGLVCYMNLRNFPLDRQYCFIKIESYGHTMDEMILEWRAVDPVQTSEDLELPQFNLIRTTTEGCTKSYITGSYACLKATTLLERQYGYYMIQTYVPSLLIVSLSWVSFWINMDAVPARITLGVLTVLTLTTQCVGVWMSLPRVSYIKAIDIWMSMCVVMVFAAMLEFAIVNTLGRQEIRRMSQKARSKANDAEGSVPSDMIKRMMDEYQYGTPQIFDPNSRQIARRIDKLARKAFPIFFISFNIVYWCFFLIN